MIAFDENQAAVGDAFCYEPGVGFFDHVIGSCDHKGFCMDRSKFFGIHVGIIDHKAKHFRVEFCRLTSTGKETGDPVTELDGELNRPFNTGGIKVCSVENETVNTIRITKGEDQSDIAAVGKAEDIRSVYQVFIHEIKKVIRKLTDGKGGVTSWCPAVASGIQSKNMEMPGENICLVLEIITVFPVTVKQYERTPLSFFNEKVFDIHSGLGWNSHL